MLIQACLVRGRRLSAWPPVGWVRFGSLRRTTPISRLFGLDRGARERCIDIFFIERFLRLNQGDIRGHVLEIGDDHYTRKFGGTAVERSDVLHVRAGTEHATIIADLSRDDHIPSDSFDCIICTQTLQFVYDMRAAVKTLHRILRAGGVLLATFTGISQISRYDMDRWGDYWRVTALSARRLFEQFWPADSVEVQAHGNVLLAVAYLHGLTIDEVSERERDCRDQDYQLVVTVRAMKPGNSRGEPQMIARGWDDYAKTWEPSKFPVLPGHPVEHLGDEWTGEDSSAGGTTYGLDEDSVAHFSRLLKEQVLDPYLPPRAREGLEIGPGGGRFTALLLPRTGVLHAADPSDAMLKRLKARFAGVDSLRTYQTDGMTLPPLRPSNLDYVVSFDVFVHFEPRLVYWYLRQIKSLLKPGGVGLIHYASVLSPIGWRQFEADLERNVRQRTAFQTFGVMCPQLMEKFLKVLDLQIISSDVGFIPRDAIAVFKQPT